MIDTTVRHFGNHEVHENSYPLFTPESKRTLVTLSLPGVHEHHYRLTPEQRRLLDKLQSQGLLASGLTVTIHDMERFQEV